MKTMMKNVLFALMCVALLAVALGLGAVRGWNADRREVLEALTGEGEMRTRLEHRGMDAANLAVVAARHLPEDDADLLALREASATLLSGTEDVEKILAADAVITDVAMRFADVLPQQSTMKDNQRDMAYVTRLTGSLGTKGSLTHNYALLVEDFNQQLTTSLSGKLAMLLGVKPLPAPAN